jgi:hypothetical protein
MSGLASGRIQDMNVVAEMLLTEPAPAAIWATLMLIAFPALLLLGSPNGIRHPRRAAREMAAVVRQRASERAESTLRQAQEAAQAVRLAEEVGVAADRAAASAERWQQCWEQSTEDLNAAWQAWLDADARLRTALAGAAWGTPWSVRTCEEYAARERFLHRAVAAAADRGELPAAAVADALAGRHGWDPRLHPVEQELVIARASAAWLRQRYERAVTAERAAWHDAELARRAAGSLRHEAAATARAAQRSELLPAGIRTAAGAGRRPVTVATA